MAFFIRTIFYTFWCMLCCHTVNVKAYKDAITKEYRQELYEMLFFNKRLHISDSVTWSLLYKHN